MGDTRIHWNLYVDESGKFDEPGEAVVVAGLLLRPGGGGPTPMAIRDTLWRAAPDVPWTLHASRLRYPVLLALAAEARRDQIVSPPPHSQRLPRDAGLDALADRAIAILRQLEPELLKKAREILRAPQKNERKSKKTMPDWADLRCLDNRLREGDSQLYLELNVRMRRLNVLVEQTLSAVQPATEPGQLPMGMLVVCGEHHDGDALRGGADDDPLGSIRYAGVLEGLLARLHELLEYAGGRHLVWLHVLTRGHLDPFLGPRFEARLNPQHIGDVANRVCRNDPDDDVRLLPGSAPRFDSRVDPLLVLADFAANRCLHVLRPRRKSLHRAEEELRAQIGAVLRAGSPPLPAIAAVWGEPCPEGPGRRWAEEQATEWQRRDASNRAEQAS